MPELEAHYSFRHTRDYRVAQTCNRIVWIDYKTGQHELFVQDIPDGKRRLLHTSHGDDGEPLRLVTLSPSGRYLLITQGDFSGVNSCTNPRRKTTPPAGFLQLVDTDGETPPRPIANTLVAAINPNESSITWARHGCVYSQTIEDSPVKELFRIRGDITDINWRPDGSRLAFVCERDEHALLGIYQPGISAISWISPDFDRKMNPVWSKDGQHLAFLRFNGPKPDIAEQLFSNKSDSFAVMVTNISTGETRAAWESSLEEGAGFSLQYGNRPLTWLDGQRLIFSHDASGWDHIYQYDIADNSCTALTEGYWLIQDYCNSSDGKLVVASHNGRRRYLYRLSVLDTETKEKNDLPLCQDSQFWRPSFSADDKYVFFVMGSETSPCHIAYLDRASGKTIRLSQQTQRFSDTSRHFTTPKIHTLKSLDSRLFHSQIFMPEGPGPFPAVLNIHGGPFVQSLPGFHPHLGMSFQYAFCQLLAKCGFLVMDINYRGSSGFGKTFRQAPERGWDGASDYQDVQTAAQWLTRHPNVDRRRIGVIGESWGGYLGSLALARDSGLIRAGVVINGCHNFPRELSRPHWGSKLFTSDKGETATETIARAKIAEDSSPWGWLDQWMSPVLIVHGDDDHCVAFAESLHLAHALRYRSVEVESLVLPDEGHEFLLHESWLTIGNRALAFLKRQLES
ncbi:prolyl oligopeptidase family serine peptidase [Sansalvadorimonas sp. 2012CJ34-2]|uniref:Prolyl oligopeptidase family serine peptidase n=1 Tax=Parendozoicomonas callyspongiae TaxID=2942213 RepID=A0ABT0PF73_9GAMM|nr:prolyl oligopeptidase family serine peptidase [Sansalvadorimonas sp. 2012CJ34-2]MCL6269916.1 prolyl oligopeptidase family serine peptidase [Sansalvadorimonas sp. 2012CJ34-2]